MVLLWAAPWPCCTSRGPGARVVPEVWAARSASRVGRTSWASTGDAWARSWQELAEDRRLQEMVRVRIQCVWILRISVRFYYFIKWLFSWWLYLYYMENMTICNVIKWSYRARKLISQKTNINFSRQSNFSISSGNWHKKLTQLSQYILNIYFIYH